MERHFLGRFEPRHRLALSSPAHGFTLLELMIAVAIIGLLAVIAIPSYQKVRLRSANVAFVNDLRVLSDGVFQRYAIMKGDYPPAAAAGVMPPEVADLMPRRFDWAKPTPVGGTWKWERAGQHGEFVNGCYACIEVLQPDRTTVQMQEIDDLVDDGNLATGKFQAIPNGYAMILE